MQPDVFHPRLPLPAASRSTKKTKHLSRGNSSQPFVLNRALETPGRTPKREGDQTAEHRYCDCAGRGPEALHGLTLVLACPCVWSSGLPGRLARQACACPAWTCQVRLHFLRRRRRWEISWEPRPFRTKVTRVSPEAAVQLGTWALKELSWFTLGPRRLGKWEDN